MNAYSTPFLTLQRKIMLHLLQFCLNTLTFVLFLSKLFEYLVALTFQLHNRRLKVLDLWVRNKQIECALVLSAATYYAIFHGALLPMSEVVLFERKGQHQAKMDTASSHKNPISTPGLPKINPLRNHV